MAEAIGRAGLTFTVFLEVFFVQDGVKELPVGLRKNQIGGLRLLLSTSLWKGFTAPLMLLQ